MARFHSETSDIRRVICFYTNESYPASLHHQHRTLSELHDPIRTATKHSLVQRRVPRCPDDEQINLELGRKPDDVAHRMPRQKVSTKFDVMLFRHGACALENAMKASGRRSCLFPNFLDEFREIPYLFD